MRCHLRFTRRRHLPPHGRRCHSRLFRRRLLLTQRAALAASDFFARERVGGTSAIDRTERLFRKRLGSHIGEVVRVATFSLEAFGQVRLLVRCDFFAGGNGSKICILMRPRLFRWWLVPIRLCGAFPRATFSLAVSSRGDRFRTSHERLFRSRHPAPTWPEMSLATFSLAATVHNLAWDVPCDFFARDLC